ncbi:MAG TPA: hypothetical protein VEH76_14725 [Methylocystis sp.]|nr:hypothetical protein [Methylocystis sp.]
MKRKVFGRFIGGTFAAKAGEEISCSDYFDQLPRHVEFESCGEDAAALLPKAPRHMRRCPECEGLYLGVGTGLRERHINC